MTRTNRSARQAGARFERVIADYLAANVDERVDRRVKNGSRDRGDIGGLRIHGQRIVAELKDCATQKTGEWLREMETERGNDDALAGVLITKRRGIAEPGEQLVVTTVDNLVALITGVRPGE